MSLDDESAWTLLRHLDDPDHMEFPHGYDHTAARARFDQLAAHLDQRFQCTCTVDRQVQDASHHGRISIPETATAGGDRITVTVSNFGNLAAVTLGNSESCDEDEERELFQATDRHRVENVLEALGYVAISEHLLRTRYDGVSDLVSYYPPEHPPRWWTRFFDYL
ncbi:hypothetical protein ACH4S8_41750 [Streptomyces sp. NPDC021080]|uniref:hypothetical protein n=1 Tax=Streptomyces sp. NPDC021080 TaxID=3365110 RepID=UPI0037999B5F